MRKTTVLMLFLLLLLYRPWLIPQYANIGPDLSLNFSPFTSGFPLPWTWANTLTGDGQGIYSVFSLWTYPAQAFYQILLLLKVPFWLQMKYFAFLPALIIAIVGMRRLSRHLIFDWRIASFYFLANNYLITLIDGGQLNLVIAYCLIPISVNYFLSLKNLTSKSWAKFVMSIWIISCFDIRVVILESIILLFFSLKLRYKLSDLIKIGLFTSIAFVGLQSYWLLPAIFAKFSVLSSSYGTASQVQEFSFTSLIHGMFIQSPNWYHNIFGQIESPRWYLGLISLVIFSSLLVASIKKRVFGYIVMLIVAIFLVKGSQVPFGELYVYAIKYIPLLKIFRDASKFFILISFFSSLILGTISHRFTNRFTWIKFALLILIAICIWPAYLNRLTGTFASPHLEVENQKFINQLQSDSTFSRTLWIPGKLPSGFSSVTHPASEAQWDIYKRPYFTNITGTYELFNYLRSPATASLLDISSIRYLVYPDVDQRKKILKPDQMEYEKWFQNYFSSQSWLSVMPQFSGLNVYENKNTSPHFFAVKNIAWIVGPDDTYTKLAELGVPLRNIAVIHVDQYPQILSKIWDMSGINHRLIFNNTGPLDLTLSNINRNKLISPAKLVEPYGTDPSGWWARNSSEILDLRSILNSKYNLDFHEFDLDQGYALSEGEHTLSINLPAGNLFVRVLESSAGGELVFSDSDKQKTLTSLSTASASLRWQPVFKTSSRTNINITSKGKLNLINAFIVISDDDLVKLKEASDAITKTYPPGDMRSLSDLKFTPPENPEFIYHNPTKYGINIKSGPAILMFTDNYHAGWTVPKFKSNSFPSYSLINAFYIPQSGDFDVYFSPQRFVIPGLGLFCSSLLVLIIISCRKK